MRGKGLLALLVLLLLLVVLAPYTFLPPLLESVVARTFQDQLGLERTPEVELESDPAPMMYAGSFSKALVSMEGVELGGVKTDKVGMELDPFNLNIVESVTSGTVSTEQPLSGRLQVELSEDNASSLAKTVLAVPVQDVQLEEGQVILKLALGFGSPVSVRGPLILQNEVLSFKPQRVDGAPPGVSTQQLLAVSSFAYPVTGLPFGAHITGVEAQKDRLVLSGEVQNIPLGAPVG